MLSSMRRSICASVVMSVSSRSGTLGAKANMFRKRMDERSIDVFSVRRASEFR